MLDGISDFIKQAEYLRFSVQNEHFKHSPKMQTQINAHNPKFTQVTNSIVWQEHFGRDPKDSESPFKVYNDLGQEIWLYDYSQTKGRPLQSLYQNVSGEVAFFQLVFDCLKNLSTQPVIFDESVYYAGVGQDSSVIEDKIVMRSALSQQQMIFALVREIIRATQTSAIVVEAASYMVCRHLDFRTNAFSYGYLLELMCHDVSLSVLKNKSIEDTIINEASIVIGSLNGSLPFLQGTSSQGDSSGSSDVELEERHENTGKPETAAKIDKIPYSTREQSEIVNDIDFRIIAILRDFMRTMPDKSVSIEEMVEYGYHDKNMIPIREAVARNLFAENREIYRLYEDGTDTKVDFVEDIDKHRGLYGISESDWFLIKTDIIRNSMDNEVKKISLWEQAAAGELNPNGANKYHSEHSSKSTKNRKQPQTFEQAKLNHKTASAQRGKQVKQKETQEMFKFDENGNIIFDTPDIKHTAEENYDWIDGAMEDLIDNHGYKTTLIPYFREYNGLGISNEMEVINEFMIRYCFFQIKIAVAEHTETCKKTGNIKYFVQKAVRQVLADFKARHIALALKTNWKGWTLSDKVKVQFFKDFQKLQAVPQAQIQRKKSSPEEDMARMKARDETKTTSESENGQAEHEIATGRRAAIINLINVYKINLKTKPKNSKADKVTVKAMRESAQSR